MDDDYFSPEYKITEGTGSRKPEEEYPEVIKIDLENYRISKPKRIIIRSKIIHD